MINLVKKCTSSCFNIVVGHLFPAVRGQVEDKNCEEGDTHAGDDQVHLVVMKIITKKVSMITNVKMMMITKEKFANVIDLLVLLINKLNPW